MTGVDERIARYAEVWQRDAELPAVPDLGHRERPRFRLAAAAASVAVLAAGAAVVALSSRGEPPAASSALRSPDAATAPDIDRYAPETAAFFARLAPRGGASEVERYASLRDAFDGAGLVVVAEVTGVRATRSVPAAGPDAVPYVGVVLRPVEVLHGAPRDPAADLVVEFAGDEESVRAALPAGYGVFLLRNKADLPPGVMPKPGAPSRADDAAYYRLVSSQGLFVQGATHVVNPVRERATPEAGAPLVDPELAGPRDPVAREAEAFPTLSALVAYLRAL